MKRLGELVIKACPFCGKTDTLEYIEDDCNGGYGYIQCCGNLGGCGISSGWNDSFRDAVEAWNMRAYEQEDGDGEREDQS